MVPLLYGWKGLFNVGNFKDYLTIYKIKFSGICKGVQFSMACAFLKNGGWDDIDCHEGLRSTRVTSIFLHILLQSLDVDGKRLY